MKFSPYNPPYTAYSQWSALVPEGMYTAIPPSAMSPFVPQSLMDKSNSILLQASASGNRSYFVANINRVDIRDSAIDQQPYIVEFDHQNSLAYGGFLDHPNWDKRTTKQSQDFFTHISISGTGAYYPISEMPIMGFGTLDDLQIVSQSCAFENALSALRASRR